MKNNILSQQYIYIIDRDLKFHSSFIQVREAALIASPSLTIYVPVSLRNDHGRKMNE